MRTALAQTIRNIGAGHRVLHAVRLALLNSQISKLKRKIR